ncbi:MAG: RidA family protein [Calditrichaeota bacterium]|nr:RidA family protein [Calditrichota bacterium]MCB0294814.1 RidA family protein [Calditrichota bacterium]
MKKIVRTDKAPLPVGPYNQAVVINGLVFTAGQIAIDPATNQLLPGDVEAQTRLVMENLGALLNAAGASLERVIKTTIFLKDMNDFPRVNAVYGSFFEEASAPARSTVEVSRLPKDVLVEIECIAEVNG